MNGHRKPHSFNSFQVTEKALIDEFMGLIDANLNCGKVLEVTAGCGRVFNMVHEFVEEYHLHDRSAR